VQVDGSTQIGITRLADRGSHLGFSLRLELERETLALPCVFALKRHLLGRTGDMRWCLANFPGSNRSQVFLPQSDICSAMRVHHQELALGQNICLG
jgi:hypothetical protein